MEQIKVAWNPLPKLHFDAILDNAINNVSAAIMVAAKMLNEIQKIILFKISFSPISVNSINPARVPVPRYPITKGRIITIDRRKVELKRTWTIVVISHHAKSKANKSIIAIRLRIKIDIVYPRK